VPRSPAWLRPVCFVLFCLLPQPANAEEPAPRTRRVHISYSAQVRDVSADAREIILWLPFPPTNESQEVSNITVRSDVPTSVNREEEYGNQVLSVKVQNPGNKPIAVEMQFDVLRRERRNAAAIARRPAPEQAVVEKIDPRWLARDNLVPIDGKVLDLAREVTGDRPERFEQVRAIYDHTVSNLKYDKRGTGWGRGDIAYACDAKRGNCTDFHAVFIGLCRALGIPAQFEIGFSLPADEHSGEISGYHCWADCHIAEYGWIPVDCSEAQKHPEKREYFFGALDEDRVALSVGRDIRLNPPQQGERLNYFVYPYAEIDGNPHEKIDRRIRFENP
jgi:transglutaminase-like putative cysteine protease